MPQHGNVYFRCLLCRLKDFNAPPVDHEKMGTRQISIHTLTAMQCFSPAALQPQLLLIINNLQQLHPANNKAPNLTARKRNGVGTKPWRTRNGSNPFRVVCQFRRKRNWPLHRYQRNRYYLLLWTMMNPISSNYLALLQLVVKPARKRV